MLVNRSVRKFVVLVLAGATVAGVEVGTGAMGTQAEAATTSSQGDPHAVPPILRPATASELAEIRVAEAWDGLELYYDPPASARYSGAVFNAFAK
jgi:hypothetical protein